MATKVKCQCGLELNEDNMNKHLTTKTHGELIERKYRKLSKFTVTDISKEHSIICVNIKFCIRVTAILW